MEKPDSSAAAPKPLVVITDEAWELSARRDPPDPEVVQLMQCGRGPTTKPPRQPPPHQNC
jgi:hypothetical protein